MPANFSWLGPLPGAEPEDSLQQVDQHSIAQYMSQVLSVQDLAALQPLTGSAPAAPARYSGALLDCAEHLDLAFAGQEACSYFALTESSKLLHPSLDSLSSC